MTVKKVSDEGRVVVLWAHTWEQTQSVPLSRLVKLLEKRGSKIALYANAMALRWMTLYPETRVWLAKRRLQGLEMPYLVEFKVERTSGGAYTTLDLGVPIVTIQGGGHGTVHRLELE